MKPRPSFHRNFANIRDYGTRDRNEVEDGRLMRLMVTLHASPGANRKEDSFQALQVEMPADGNKDPIKPAWFSFLADMHLRFVFDSKFSVQSVNLRFLAEVNLTPELALELAIANIRRAYGDPEIASWIGGLQIIKGKSPDFVASYFFDYALWEDLLHQHPKGLVVAVPKRGSLIFTPFLQTRIVEGLQKAIVDLYDANDPARVSSALYLFNKDGWTIFQEPLASK